MTLPSILSHALTLSLMLSLPSALLAQTVSEPTPVATEAASVQPPPPLTTAPTGPGRYFERQDVAAFVQGLLTRHPELDAQTVQRAMAQATYQPSVAKLIMPATQKGTRNWSVYRTRMVDELRVRSGRVFMARYATELAEAERQSGVPAHIIAGIIGVETIYGRNMGSFRAVDALSTLAFDFPKGRSDRSEFFRSELEALFVLAAQSRRDPMEIRGSYAGALGWPQFMPSSWLQYAVDFDGDGRIDLMGSPIDAIGSVANYLALAGKWQRGQATHYRVQAPSDEQARASLLKPDIVPTFAASEFLQLGATLEPRALLHPGKLALIELVNGLEAAPGYVAGTENFYAVTRYNWSSFYAMAVIELGEAIGPTPIGTAETTRR